MANTVEEGMAWLEISDIGFFQCNVGIIDVMSEIGFPSTNEIVDNPHGVASADERRSTM